MEKMLFMDLIGLICVPHPLLKLSLEGVWDYSNFNDYLKTKHLGWNEVKSQISKKAVEERLKSVEG